MVIFGAGASYDSCPTYPPGSHVTWGITSPQDNYYRPPLAKELFANRPVFASILDQFPLCKGVVPRFRDPAVVNGTVSIEARLRELEEEANVYPRGRQELASIKCYLQQAILSVEEKWNSVTHGITNYVSLLRELHRLRKKDEPICLVTFNYDTLLEQAVGHTEREIRTIEDYTNSALFRIFKLHGSVNWGRYVDLELPLNVNVEGESILEYLIENASELSFSNEFVLWRDSRTMRVPHEGRLWFPAIAIPVAKKSDFECPEFMLNQLRALLPKVTRGLIIGWRATEEHFFAMLREHLTEKCFFAVVAGSEREATETRDRIHHQIPSNPPSISPMPMGFSDFMRGGQCVQILKNW